MNWYIAKVIFKITSGTNKCKAQFDEHLRLIEAETFEKAFRKARLIGIREEDQFVNEQHQPVKWEFVNVTELIPINELRDGLEVYSKIHETTEGSAYINFIHRKAESLQLEQ